MRYFLIFLTSLLISGCVEDSEQKISDLESSGGIPSLDRSIGISGPDSDNNGIRDDIDSYISNNYSPNQQDSAKQMARAFQNILTVDQYDDNALNEASTAQFKALVCAAEIFEPNRGDGYKMADTIESLTTNTKERLLAYLNYNSARSGSVSSYPEGDTCE